MTINIGLVGSGKIVGAFIDAVSIIPELEIKALFEIDKNSERVKSFCEKNKIERVYDDYDEFLKDPTIALVYVATPNGVHFKQAKHALLAHKSVIVEKPFTSNIIESEILKELATERNLFIFEAMSVIYTEAFKQLSGMIDKIGEIKSVQLNCSSLSPRYLQLKEGIVTNIFNPELAGGALMDLNIYNTSFLVKLFGKPEKVKYFANKYENGIDTSGTLILVYPSFVATSVGAKDSGSKNYALIQGEQGYIEVIDGVNGMTKFDIAYKDMKQSIVTEPKGNRLYEEISTFTDIMINEDYDTCYGMLKHTVSVINVLDAARKDASICFPSDVRES